MGNIRQRKRNQEAVSHRKLILNSNLTNSRSSSAWFVQSFWNFARSSTISLLWTRFQTDWETEKEVMMGKRNFVRFGFKMSLGWISYIAQSMWLACRFIFVCFIFWKAKWQGGEKRGLQRHCGRQIINYSIAWTIVWAVIAFTESQFMEYLLICIQFHNAGSLHVILC